MLCAVYFVSQGGGLIFSADRSCQSPCDPPPLLDLLERSLWEDRYFTACWMSAVTVCRCLECAMPGCRCLQRWHPGNVNLERALGEDSFLSLAIAGAQLATVVSHVCHCFVAAGACRRCFLQETSPWLSATQPTRDMEEVCPWTLPSRVPD